MHITTQAWPLMEPVTMARTTRLQSLLVRGIQATMEEWARRHIFSRATLRSPFFAAGLATGLHILIITGTQVTFCSTTEAGAAMSVPGAVKKSLGLISSS